MYAYIYVCVCIYTPLPLGEVGIIGIDRLGGKYWKKEEEKDCEMGKLEVNNVNYIQRAENKGEKGCLRTRSKKKRIAGGEK